MFNKFSSSKFGSVSTKIQQRTKQKEQRNSSQPKPEHAAASVAAHETRHKGTKRHNSMAESGHALKNAHAQNLTSVLSKSKKGSDST